MSEHNPDGYLCLELRVEADDEVRCWSDPTKTHICPHPNLFYSFWGNHHHHHDNDQVTAITIDNGKRSKRLLTVIPGLERFLIIFITIFLIFIIHPRIGEVSKQ